MSASGAERRPSSGEARIAARTKNVLVELAAPRGFGATYRRIAAEPSTPDALADLLGLVGYQAAAEAIEGWPLVRRVEAEAYAANVHLRASNNPLPACPRPAWMGEPWQGPPEGEGLWEMPGGTPL